MSAKKCRLNTLTSVSLHVSAMMYQMNKLHYRCEDQNRKVRVNIGIIFIKSYSHEYDDDSGAILSFLTMIKLI